MVFRKQVLNSDAGSGDEVGGDDWDTYDQYHDDVDLAPAVSKVNTRSYFRSGKFEIRNPANDASYVFIGSALAASRNLTLPLLTAGDTLAVLDLAQTFTNKTIAAGSNTITGIVDANIDVHTTTKITTTSKSLLNSSIVYIDQANIFSDNSQTFRSGKLALTNPANTFTYFFTGDAIVANRIVTMPLLVGDDIFVMEAFTQTLTNKTISGSSNTLTDIGDASLSANVALLNSAQTFTTAAKTFNDQMVKFRNPADTFSYTLIHGAIGANRNITLPALTGNDIFTFNDATQTLTNKTLTSPVINTSTITDSVQANFMDWTKVSAPSDPGAEVGRVYFKEIDANNNTLAIKQQVGGSIIEVLLS
jgi:hypothetical protein